MTFEAFEKLMAAAQALDALKPFVNVAEGAIFTAFAIFVRISLIVFLLPGFGERIITTRVKLGVAVAFAIVSWPMVSATAPNWSATNIGELGVIYLAEGVNGALLGVLTRILVFALQTAGALAAQSLSISQMFGAGVAPDPEPTIATILTFAGIAMAMSLGLHVKAAELIILSYQALPLGQFPLAGDTAELMTARWSEGFRFGISLALPFVIVAFMYNLSLGFINKAMPQLMVTFVGLPAITWIGLLLLGLTSTNLLLHWNGRLDEVMSSPLGV